jgi:hypothetical protein
MIVAAVIRSHPEFGTHGGDSNALPGTIAPTLQGQRE